MTAELAGLDRVRIAQSPRRGQERSLARVLTRPRAQKIDERLTRLEWYYREYGRAPTWDELMALRTYRQNG